MGLSPIEGSNPSLSATESPVAETRRSLRLPTVGYPRVRGVLRSARRRKRTGERGLRATSSPIPRIVSVGDSGGSVDAGSLIRGMQRWCLRAGVWAACFANGAAPGSEVNRFEKAARSRGPGPSRPPHRSRDHRARSHPRPGEDRHRRPGASLCRPRPGRKAGSRCSGRKSVGRTSCVLEAASDKE